MTSQEEVREALQMNPLQLVGGIEPSRAEDVLQQRYQRLLQDTVALRGATNNLYEAEARLVERAAHLDRLSAGLEHHLSKNARRNQRRQRSILRHVSQHLRDVEERCEAVADDLQWTEGKLGELLALEKMLNLRIGETEGALKLMIPPNNRETEVIVDDAVDGHEDVDEASLF
jgi:hypothetical protein